MARLESVIIDVIPHPDTRGSKNWWIVAPNEYVSDADEGRSGDSQEVEGKATAIRDAKLLARWYVDTGVAGRATISIDGSELTTYVAKKSRSGKRHVAPGRSGGKKRHSKFKLVDALHGTVLDRVRAKSPKHALRKRRAAGHSTTGVSAVRAGGKKRHAGIGGQVAELKKLLK